MAAKNDLQRDSLLTSSIDRAFGRINVFKLAPHFRQSLIIQTQSAYHFPPHIHYSYEVIIVKQGNYKCRLNNQMLELKPFQGIIAKPGDRHEDFCRVPLVYFVLSFDLFSNSLESPNFFIENTEPAKQCFEMDESVLSSLEQRLQQENDMPDALTVHIQDAILMEFFWHLIRALGKDVISENVSDLFHQNSFLNHLLSIFHENLSRQLSLGEIADIMGISESSLSHKCRKILGMSTAKAFMKCKMEHALDLLGNTNKLVKEIAFLTGFQDQYCFSKTFKKYYGLSPSYYRKNEYH